MSFKFLDNYDYIARVFLVVLSNIWLVGISIRGTRASIPIYLLFTVREVVFILSIFNIHPNFQQIIFNSFFFHFGSF